MRWGVAVFVAFVALWCHSQAATHTVHSVKGPLEDFENHMKLLHKLKREVAAKSSEESGESKESKEAKAVDAPKETPKTTTAQPPEADESDASASDAERPKRASEYVYLPKREFFANIVKQFAKRSDDSNESSDESTVSDKEVESFQQESGLWGDSVIRRFLKSVEKVTVDPTTMGKRKSSLFVHNALARWWPENLSQSIQFLVNIRAMVDAGADISERVGYLYLIKQNRLYSFSLSSVMEWGEAFKDPLESRMLLNRLPWDNYRVYFESNPAIAARFKSDDQSDEESDYVENRKEEDDEKRKDDGDDEDSSVLEENTEIQPNDEESGEVEDSEYETLRIKRSPRDSEEIVRRFFGTDLSKVLHNIKKKIENLSDEFDRF